MLFFLDSCLIIRNLSNTILHNNCSLLYLIPYKLPFICRVVPIHNCTLVIFTWAKKINLSLNFYPSKVKKKTEEEKTPKNQFSKKKDNSDNIKPVTKVSEL